MGIGSQPLAHPQGNGRVLQSESRQGTQSARILELLNGVKGRLLRDDDDDGENAAEIGNRNAQILTTLNTNLQANRVRIDIH